MHSIVWHLNWATSNSSSSSSSGSTLIGQIFEETGVCVIYSEPHFLNLHWKDGDPSEMKRTLKAPIAFYCKPRKEPTSEFVFKQCPMGRSLSPVFHELFPKTKLVHLTRNATANAKSSFKVMQVTNLTRLLAIFMAVPLVPNIMLGKYSKC